MNFPKKKYIKIKDYFFDYLNVSNEVIKKIDLKILIKIANLLENKIKSNKNIFICGNGGSAAIANHYVADYLKLLRTHTKLKPKLIESLYNAGLQQMVVSMYDGPEQIQYFKDLFKESNVGDNYYTLRDRWYDEEEDYGLLYTNRAGSMGDKLLSPHERPCYYTHYSTYIDWNGDVLLCCQDMYNRTKIFGNVLEKKLVDIWIDKKLIDYRKKLSVGKRVLSPCDNCTANGMVFGDKHSKLW